MRLRAPLCNPNRLDLVPNLDGEHDIHATCDLAEVRVLLVEKGGVFLYHEPLAVVVERGILTARDADRAELETQIVVLARHAIAAGPGSFGIATLDDPVLDAVEGQVVVKTATRFACEPLDGLRRLVGPERECERSPFGELDGRLCRVGAGCLSGRSRPSSIRTALRGRTTGNQREAGGKGLHDRAALHRLDDKG